MPIKQSINVRKPSLGGLVKIDLGFTMNPPERGRSFLWVVGYLPKTTYLNKVPRLKFHSPSILRVSGTLAFQIRLSCNSYLRERKEFPNWVPKRQDSDSFKS